MGLINRGKRAKQRTIRGVNIIQSLKQLRRTRKEDKIFNEILISMEEIEKKQKEEEKQWRESGKRKKKKIITAVRTKHMRLTEPKKRNILKRISLQKQYLRGDFRDTERAYKKGKINEDKLFLSKIARSKKNQQLYKEIQEYEDCLDDVAVREALKSFKRTMLRVSMITVTSLAVVEMNFFIKYMADRNEKYKDNNKSIEEVMEELTEDEKTAIKNKIKTMENDIGYKFSLTEDEQIEAVTRLQRALENKTEEYFRGRCLKMEDQEALEEILIEAYDSEYYKLSEKQGEEITELLFLILPEDCQKWCREPFKILGIYDVSNEGNDNEIGD